MNSFVCRWSVCKWKKNQTNKWIKKLNRIGLCFLCVRFEFRIDEWYEMHKSLSVRCNALQCKQVGIISFCVKFNSGEQQLVFHKENMEQPSATARPYKTDRLNWFSDNLCIFFHFVFVFFLFIWQQCDRETKRKQELIQQKKTIHSSSTSQVESSIKLN